MKPTRPLKPSSSEVRQMEQMKDPMWESACLASSLDPAPITERGSMPAAWMISSGK